jgi:hypothetical protein
LACVILLLSRPALAGPPYVTDDPEPVEFQHWEVNLASLPIHTTAGLSGQLFSADINYGAAPNLQLHVMPVLDFSAPSHGSALAGYADTELGVKYRFVQETATMPQISVYPLLEVPTGNARRGFGTGHLDALLPPIWMQKSFGKWTMYGGGGYWINPGAGNQNWEYAGALLQRQVFKTLSLGVEVFHETAQTRAGSSTTTINAGGTWDLSDHYHLLFSGGHSLQGPNAIIGYLGLQLTFGPEHEPATEGK